MSGTSMDGIDAVLVHMEDDATTLRAHHSQPYPAELRQKIADLARGVADDVHTLAVLDRRIGAEFASASNTLLKKAHCCAADVTAIGSHGQTVRHSPSDKPALRYSLQIGDPATIAELTGISTVADFRRQDIAAGGEGAPLVPGFHAQCFGREGTRQAIVNIGGIANATLLQGKKVLAGFDCGPGNTLLDAWIARHHGLSYDADGAWSAEHTVLPALFDALSGDAFLSRSGPRSTGPEYFNMDWLASHLTGTEAPGDVQATLAELTAFAIFQSLPGNAPIDAVYVCGGGARNRDIMRRIHERLGSRGIRLGLTDELGLAAEWVEAAAFAWLAQRRLAGLPGNVPSATGASGARLLGAIYAGRQTSGKC